MGRPLTILLLVTWGAIAAFQLARAQSGVEVPSLSKLPSIYELLDTRYTFEKDGTGRKEVIAKIRILSEMGTLQQAEQTFEYHPLSEELQIPYVRVRTRDGDVTNVEVNVVQPRPVGVTADSDLDERRVRIPGLTVGDQVEFDVVTVIRRSLGPGEFCVQHSFQPSGVLDEQLEVDVLRDRELKLKSIPNLKVWKTVEGTRRVYHWESENSEAAKVIAVPYIPGRTPDVQVSSFSSWEEVGRWYSDLEKNHRAPSPEIRAKADELTKGSKSDMEKAEALYNFAAKQIRYVSLVSFGIGGSEPRSASETLHKGYGDCKDKTALLEALLEAGGLRASTVLISGDRKLDFDVASPWPFDHVITTLEIGKDRIWLDPSSAVLPFNMLAYPLRGKQSLMLPTGGVPHFEQTPAEAPVPSIWSEEIDGKVAENGRLEATIRITARGDAELQLRQDLLSPAASMRAWAVRGAVMGIEPNDKVTDVEISDPTATNEPFILSFHLTRPIFIRVWEKEYSAKLPLSHCRLDALGGYPAKWDNPVSSAVRLGPPRQCRYKITIEFAQTFQVGRPSPSTLQSSYASYVSTYTSQGNVLVANRTLTVYRDELPLSLTEAYRVFLQQMMAEWDSGIAVRVTESVAPTREDRT